LLPAQASIAPRSTAYLDAVEGGQVAEKLVEEGAFVKRGQVIARVDDQVILACELLWRVNQMLEEYQRKAPPGQRVPQDQLEITRKQLMQKEVAGMVDRKLLFNQFRRSCTKRRGWTVRTRGIDFGTSRSQCSARIPTATARAPVGRCKRPHSDWCGPHTLHSP